VAVNWEESVLIPCTAVFGQDVPATYYPGDNSAAFPVVPVFDEGFKDTVVIDVTSPTSDARPACGINASQFPAGTEPLQDDVLFVPGSVKLWYIVREVRPDRHGNFLLLLAETDPV
jgi:hypothetical protein